MEGDPGAYLPKLTERDQLTLYLHYRGKLGRAPDWYRVWRQAEALKTHPWLISGEARPCYRYWGERALLLEWAEYDATHGWEDT